MQHAKHKFSLGRKKEHRQALISNLASQLFLHGKIKTTLTKAKALRPFAEKAITLAKKSYNEKDAANKLHFRRLAIARLKNNSAVKILFDERVQEFLKRNGGYTRIYKLMPRVGDAADQALIELISSTDKGYRSRRKKTKQKVDKNVEAHKKETVAQLKKEANVSEKTKDSVKESAVAPENAETK